MRLERISRWLVALVVTAAAVTKLVQAEPTERGVEDLLMSLGTGPVPAAVLVAAIWTFSAAEVVLGAVILFSSRPRWGLSALLALICAGIVLLGVATSGGRDADFACPCGLPFELPWLRNTFAALLVRDAVLVALIALAWGPRDGAAPGDVACDPRTPGDGAVA